MGTLTFFFEFDGNTVPCYRVLAVPYQYITFSRPVFIVGNNAVYTLTRCTETHKPYHVPLSSSRTIILYLTLFLISTSVAMKYFSSNIANL